MTVLSRIDEQIDALKMKLAMNIYETDFYKKILARFSSKVIHQNLTVGIQNYRTGANPEFFPVHFHLMALYILYEIIENAEELDTRKD